ncbi:MAG TPA: Ig-like domain-containing protein, partial [Candidatus Dormibacteraeota bacterium]
ERLAYVGPSGVRLIDLASGRDTLVGPATGPGAWSQDARRYAYPTDAGIAVADAGSASASKLVDLAGVTGLTWSRGNEFLVSTASWLYLVKYADGGGATARKLQAGSFAQPDWAPGGNGVFSYRRGNDLWVARLQGAVPGVAVTPAANVSQDDVISGFMLARKNGQSDQALAFLDAAGRDVFSKGLTLIYADPQITLARYSVLLSQPGRVVVRLVLAHGSVQTAVDETLTLTPDAGGHMLIHSVADTPRTSFAAGPEVVSVVVANGQVQVVFDSDLDPTTVSQPGSIGIRGVATQATLDGKQRTVTLTVPGGLTAGAGYDLQITPLLQDTGQRRAVIYDLTFVGPTSSGASPTASPSPTAG